MPRKYTHVYKLLKQLETFVEQIGLHKYVGREEIARILQSKSVWSTRKGCYVSLIPPSTETYTTKVVTLVVTLPSSRLAPRRIAYTRGIYKLLYNWRTPLYLEIPFVQTYIGSWHENSALTRFLAETLAQNKPHKIEISGIYNSLANMFLVNSFQRLPFSKDSIVYTSSLLQASVQPIPHYRNSLFAFLSLLTGGTVEYNEKQNSLTFVSIHNTLVCTEKTSMKNIKRNSAKQISRIGIPFISNILYMEGLSNNTMITKANIAVPSLQSTSMHTTVKVLSDINLIVLPTALDKITSFNSSSICMNALTLFTTTVNLNRPHKAYTHIYITDIGDIFDPINEGGLDFYILYYYIASLLLNTCTRILIENKEKIKDLATEIDNTIEALINPIMSPGSFIENTIDLIEKYFSCMIDAHLIRKSLINKIKQLMSKTHKYKLTNMKKSETTIGDMLTETELAKWLLGTLCTRKDNKFQCIAPQFIPLYELLKNIKNSINITIDKRSFLPKLICTKNLIDGMHCITSIVIDKYSLALKLLDKLKMK